MIGMQKSASNTQWLLTLPKSRFQEEEQMQMKKLEGWQKNEVRRLTFKEREQKVYSFLDEDVTNIFEQLMQLKLIELPKYKWSKDMEKVNDPNYCK